MEKSLLQPMRIVSDSTCFFCVLLGSVYLLNTLEHLAVMVLYNDSNCHFKYLYYSSPAMNVYFSFHMSILNHECHFPKYV